LIALLQGKQPFTGNALKMSRLPGGWKPRGTEQCQWKQERRSFWRSDL